MKKTISTLITIALLLLSSLSLQAQGCWKEMAGGLRSSHAVKNDGTMWAWGDPATGTLCCNGCTAALTPKRIGSDTDWKTCTPARAIKNNGTLWGWGGIPCDGTTIDRPMPVQIGTATNWAKLINSRVPHALKTDGTLWNLSGDFAHNYLPGQVGTGTWTDVAIEQHFLAIKANGTLWAWGDNTTGQLGDGTYNSTGTPIQIGTATNWKMVATATNRSFAIKTDGTMWGFGENINGETGVGITGPDILTPTQIGTGTNWDKIFAFGSVAFATKTDGSLWVWGLGINMFAQPIAQLIIRTPTRIGTATTWKSLSIAESNNGAYTALGVQTDGSRWVWGNNTIALYGDSTLTSISSTALPKRLICTTYVGVEDIQPQEASNYMQVYPNPTSGKFTLTLSDLQVNAPANLQILAATGQIAVQQTIAATATDALIDLTAQPAGLYFVSLRTANGLLLTTKVLKL